MKLSVQTKSWVCALGIFFFASCASKNKKEVCPTPAEEPISVCRASENCMLQRGSVGLGVGVGVGIGMGSFGVGASHGLSRIRYEKCLDQDLREQEAKAKNLESKKPNETSEAAPSKPAP